MSSNPEYDTDMADLQAQIDNLKQQREWLRERVAWLENALARTLGEQQTTLTLLDSQREAFAATITKLGEIVTLAQAAKGADMAHRTFIREALAREPVARDQDDDEAGVLWVARQRAFEALFAVLPDD